MAKATMKMPDEFLMKLSRLGEKTDEIVPRVLQAGAEIMERKIKSNLQAVIGKSTKDDSRSTGELVSSLGVSSAKMDRDGNYNVKIGFSEPRSDGGSNAMLANVLEYGKSGQAPKPFLKPAKSATKRDCMNAMISALDSEVSKI